VSHILPAGQHYGAISRRWSRAALAVFHARYPGRAQYPAHGNEQASLIFVESGHCTKQVGRCVIELAPGRMLFLPAGRLHTLSFSEVTTFVAAEIPAALLDRVREIGSLPSDQVEVVPREARELGARLRRELVESDSASPLVFESILLHALACVSRLAPRRIRRPPWLSRVQEVLQVRALEPLRLADIAACAGVHPGHLSREFRRFFGITPGDYVRHLRVDAAARQLTNSDAPLADIALATGFTDQAHFCRVFRRVMGVTPREHRRLTRVQGRRRSPGPAGP
jgi:AraC family transcriptional regulator